MNHAYTPLRLDDIRRAVHTVIGSDLRYLPVVDSTNRFLRDLPEGERHHGIAALAEFQIQGRGRGRRQWSAPPGSSVLLSILLRWPEGAPLPQAVMLTCLAVMDALADVTELVPGLKWPNDVLLNGRKVCGILAESAPSAAGYVVVGIGLNVNFDPGTVEAIPPGATSVLCETGGPASRETLTLALFRALDMWYGSLTEDPERVFTEWAGRLGVAGRPVIIHDTSGPWEGTAAGVRPDGGLLVRTGDGEDRLVYAADVSMRQPEDFTRS